jgi:hypothetical protein
MDWMAPPYVLLVDDDTNEMVGAISVSVGKGSTFGIVLPLQQDAGTI